MWQQNMLDRIANVANEPPPPVVERVAKPRAPGLELQFPVAWIKAEIVPADDHVLPIRVLGRCYCPAIAATRSIDAMVQAPDQVVYDRLYIELAKASEYLFPNFCRAIAIDVLEIPNVWCGRDEHAAAIDCNPRGPR